MCPTETRVATQANLVESGATRGNAADARHDFTDPALRRKGNVVLSCRRVMTRSALGEPKSGQIVRAVKPQSGEAAHVPF